MKHNIKSNHLPAKKILNSLFILKKRNWKKVSQSGSVLRCSTTKDSVQKSPNILLKYKANKTLFPQDFELSTVNNHSSNVCLGNVWES